MVGMLMEDEDRQALQRLYAALDEVKGISLHMPIGQLMAFLVVALNEGKSMKELTKIANSNISTMSRQLIDLGQRNRRMEPGYMLIEQRQNPMNLRENQYSVTLKGNHLLKGILKHLKRTKASA